MPPLDPDRLLYALAGNLLASDWSLSGLHSALARPINDVMFAAARLPQRLRATFPQRPAGPQLVGFLREDPSVMRSLRRPRRGSRTRPLPPGWLGGVTLPALPTETALAAWLGLSLPQTRWLADLGARNRRQVAGRLRTYRYRWIPRCHGLARLLEIPKRLLKGVQRKILAEILDRVPPHAAAHGFRENHSTLTNALPHCGKAILVRFDLADFFPSVTAARIFRLFAALGYPKRVSLLLTGLCTTLTPADVWEMRPGARPGADFDVRQRLFTRHLPQGAPTSPALANLAAHRLDRRLSRLAQVLGATYTRYADDLALSGDETLARARHRIEPLVGAIAINEGFSLNFRKTRLLRAGRRQHVAGITVNVRPNLPRKQFDRLKAILTNAVRHGPEAENRAGHPDFRAHLAGRVARFAAVHPGRGKKLQVLWRRIRWPET